MVLNSAKTHHNSKILKNKEIEYNIGVNEMRCETCQEAWDHEWNIDVMECADKKCENHNRSPKIRKLIDKYIEEMK